MSIFCTGWWYRLSVPAFSLQIGGKERDKSCRKKLNRESYDRTFHVLAITVCQADWDRRYSPDNRAWANAMSIPANPDAWGTDRNCYLAVSSHPGLVDLFLSQTRKAYAQEQQKTSVRDMLKKPPETTSPKISAKSKAPER